MPYLKLNFRSDYVGRRDISVFYPRQAPSAAPFQYPPGYLGRGTPREDGETYQVLWMLNGSHSNHMTWPLFTSLINECERNRLLMIMPSSQDSFSLMPELGRFFPYITEELPEKLSKILPISVAREDNFICGASYGGYMAYRMAFTYPEKYSCVGSFASPLYVMDDIREKHLGQTGFPDPDQIVDTDLNILHLVKRQHDAGVPLPKMFQSCGYEDFTWEYNIKSRDYFRALELDHTWVEFHGAHNHEFFDSACKKYIAWLPLKKTTVKRTEASECV